MARKLATSDLAQEAEAKAARKRPPLSFFFGPVTAVLASLRLTVTLFFLAIFLIFSGTLAQVHQDIWEVIDGYFRTPITWIDLQLFFPPSFFPSMPAVPGGFYFPGGWSIGVLLFINLLAAHAFRFKLQGQGRPLAAGLTLVATGCLLTWFVIVSGSNKGGLQGTPWIAWATLWQLVLAGLVGLCLTIVYALYHLDRTRQIERWALIAVGGILSTVTCWLIYQGDVARLGDPSMRVLWQLIKGGLTGFVLLAGCLLVFKKRAGVVLLHAGVGLLMINELLVGMLAVERQMTIGEGEITNFVQDIRTVEMAVIDRSPPDVDDVVTIRESAMRAGNTIRNEALPFVIEVVRYYGNSRLRARKDQENTPTTRGAGQRLTVDPLRPGTGTDVDGQVDMASAYVTFLDRENSQPLGTYLLSQHLKEQTVVVDGNPYQISLRFLRDYTPYSLKLIEVRKDDYLGTNTPKNYSSDVHLIDTKRHVDRNVKIWMNNPLRFAGKTFYQSGYHEDPNSGAKFTTLSVVTNTGWMLPYVACMIVAIGMLAHFCVSLLRFLHRQQSITSSNVPASSSQKDRSQDKTVFVWKIFPMGRYLVPRIFPLLVVILSAAWLLGKARLPATMENEMDLYQFGKLPVVYQGRVKPLDTLARNSLRIISDRQTFVDNPSQNLEQPPPTDDQPSDATTLQKNSIRLPAIRWFLDVIANAPLAGKHKIFRIENREVLQILGLPPRKGYRYALEEFRDCLPELLTQIEKAQSLPAENLSVFQKKILELDKRFRTYLMLSTAFRPPDFPPLPTVKEFEENHQLAMEQLEKIRKVLSDTSRRLETTQVPLVVPANFELGEAAWQPYRIAWANGYLTANLFGQEPGTAITSLNAIFLAYAQGDAITFNREVTEYQTALATRPPANVNTKKIDFEAFFNHFQPFYYALLLYLIAFLLAASSWLGWGRGLNLAAFWLNVFVLSIHTFALLARIYISGRPPVTNLYSSAVFIGWGCVVLALILELLYWMGIGNIVAAVAGFSTLLIAHFLAGDGDTFVVLQAVLDTQFWLATHVTCITLGYATTFVAGMLGAIYILRGVLTPSLTPDVGQKLIRMVYGTLCFALFFSFVGTVLGGLWADDSWGRFWGWDPKENGALMIVLWNALVLHARWGGMVRDRGLAVLSVAGNITTGWSWFGVNELGVGLHSYGFTEGVLRTLAIFVLSQLAIITLGCLPRRTWWSLRRRP